MRSMLRIPARLQEPLSRLRVGVAIAVKPCAAGGRAPPRWLRAGPDVALSQCDWATTPSLVPINRRGHMQVARAAQVEVLPPPGLWILICAQEAPHAPQTWPQDCPSSLTASSGILARMAMVKL